MTVLKTSSLLGFGYFFEGLQVGGHPWISGSIICCETKGRAAPWEHHHLRQVVLWWQPLGNSKKTWAYLSLAGHSLSPFEFSGIFYMEQTKILTFNRGPKGCQETSVVHKNSCSNRWSFSKYSHNDGHEKWLPCNSVVAFQIITIFSTSIILGEEVRDSQQNHIPSGFVFLLRFWAVSSWPCLLYRFFPIGDEIWSSYIGSDFKSHEMKGSRDFHCSIFPFLHRMIFLLNWLNRFGWEFQWNISR